MRWRTPNNGPNSGERVTRSAEWLGIWLSAEPDYAQAQLKTIWAVYRFVAVLATLLFAQLASAGQVVPQAETRVRAIDVVVETSLKATSLCEAETRSAEARFAVEIAPRSPIVPRGGAGQRHFGGGAHRDMKGPKGNGLDSHHMPDRGADPRFSAEDGPALRMEPADHYATSSNGRRGLEAAAYRQETADLIAVGR